MVAKKKKRKKKNEIRKDLQTVFVRAIEAFEVKQRIYIHGKCLSDRYNT
jgi:hypothetical protein